MPALALKISNAVYDPEGGDWSVQLPDIQLDRGELVLIPTTAAGYQAAFLQLLTRRARLSAGELRVLGVNLQHASIRTLARLRRSIAILSPDLGLIDDWTVRENVALPLRLEGSFSRARRKRLQAALAAVGLSGTSGAGLRQLTSTQRLLVSLAQAIVKSPKLVVVERCWGGEVDEQIARLLRDFTLGGSAVLVEGVARGEVATWGLCQEGVSQ